MNHTIINNSGGNHGHQLKDWIGSYTIGKLLDLNYYHTHYDYLDFFLPSKSFQQVVDLKCDKYIEINGPLWHGIESYTEFQSRFENISRDQNILHKFGNALRVHPVQTIDWFSKKYIKKDILKEVCVDLENIFYFDKQRKKNCDELNVCIHVDLHQAKDWRRAIGKNSYDLRFRFPIEYYLNIVSQIEHLTEKKLNFNIYAERTNSEILHDKFSNDKFTLHIGPNRREKNFEYIHSVFKNFVDADILVCSNSSFSAIASYFRMSDNNKITIYHPHIHLHSLGSYKNFIETDSKGYFK